MRYSRNCIILATLALVGLGLVMIYSSSALRAELDWGDAGQTMRKQLVWIGLGLGILVVCFDRDYRRLIRFAPWLYGITLGLLAAVLVPGLGRDLNGATRWLRMPGGLTFQVSDMAKVSMILTMAHFAVSRGDDMRTWKRGTLHGLGLILLPCALVFKEPDLGTAVVLGALGLTVMCVGGMRLSHIAPAVLLVPLAVVAAYVLFPHVQTRIDGFMNPEDSTRPGTYQVRQALIALGSGGLFGKGLGQGEMKLFGVPESNSDFILAVIGEELGLVGVTVVLLLFGTYVYHGWKISMGATDKLGMLLAVGATTLVGMQAVINIGVVTGSLPNKGISLPFISTGGTSVLFMLVTTAMLLSVANTSLRSGRGAAREPEDRADQGTPARAAGRMVASAPA